MADRERMLNIDPRQLERVMRVPAMASSPKAQEMASYRYLTAKWLPEERLIYDAVQEGYTDSGSLLVVTGLTQTQIDSALETLVRRGVISRVAPQKGLEGV